MANAFLNLPMPALNGAGASVDVSATSNLKTLTANGSFAGATITVEASVDGGVAWAPVAVFQSGQAPRTVEVCAQFMRVNVSGRVASGLFTANVDIGASSAICQFAAIPMPAGNGAGAMVDISEFGSFSTFIVGGAFSGAAVRIEISEDGIDWSTLCQFSGKGGIFSASTTANFVRAFVSGRTASSAFTATGAIGAVNTGSTGGDVPTPEFALVENFIFARTTGSDSTGDGSAARPYRTFQRAIRDVPNNIPAGTIYRVDITGIGTEVLPQQYFFPVFHGAEGIGEFDFSQRYFHYYGACNVQADPQLATGVAGITTIPAAGAVVSVPTASTGLLAIQSPGAGWTPGQLKGKFAIGAGTATQHSVIWDNTADTIFLTKRGTAPTFPVEIMECSAHLTADKDPADLHQAAVNCNNTQVALLGIKVSSTGAIPGNFNGWGLQMAGTTPPQALQLCDLPGVGLISESWVRTRQCYLPDALFLMAPLLIIQSYIHRSLEVVPAGPRVTVWGARGMDSLIRQTVIEETSTMRFRDLFDTHESGSVGLLELNFVQILNTIDDFPQIPGPLIQDGIYWTGSELRLMGVDLTRTATDPLLGVGNAVRVKGNGAYALFRSVTGTGYALGAFAQDGGFVEQDDIGGTWAPIPPAPTAVFGLTTIGSAIGADSFQCGSNAITAAWPAALYPAAGSNITDFAAGAAQGSRVWRTS